MSLIVVAETPYERALQIVQLSARNRALKYPSRLMPPQELMEKWARACMETQTDLGFIDVLEPLIERWESSVAPGSMEFQ